MNQDYDENDNDDTKRRVESLLPGLVRRVIASGAEIVGDDKMKESMVADVLRRALTKGNEVVDVTEDSVRKILSDFSMARELSDRVGAKLDDYRGEVTRVLSHELSAFFERVDLGAELRKVLEEFTIEIKTEVSFNAREKQSNEGASKQAGAAAKSKRVRKKRS
tara:strand:- start:347 stop:838 length:492 start_codon:yes stop_codon:yes gene_type:complete